jgi:hypothetical protein
VFAGAAKRLDHDRSTEGAIYEEREGVTQLHAFRTESRLR